MLAVTLGLSCGDGEDPPAPVGPDPHFPREATWYHDISAAAVDPESGQAVVAVAAAGGFGSGRLRIDFGFELLTADESTPMVPVVANEFFVAPDCEIDPVPLPPQGALEGERGYQCVGGGDCHLLIHHVPSRRLYEIWKGDLLDGMIRAGCLAVWDLSRVYGPTGRGDRCTSADAAGLPIAPLLFSADEIRRGEVDHAIRMVLPNDRIRERVYVRPATHSTPQTSGGRFAPPYGARFRLRPDFPLQTLPNEGARTVARAMQRYGMILADGGVSGLTARSDRFTGAKWGSGSGRMLGEWDLSRITVTDFDMIDAGERITWSGKCVREP